MSVDLTCSTCEGSMTTFDSRTGDFGWFVVREPCPDCTDGRRLPTLHEWDALVAERDRYREALDRIAQAGGGCVHSSLPYDLALIARAALDREDA